MEGSIKSSESIQQLVGQPRLHPQSTRGMLPAPVTVTGFSFVSSFWFIATFVLIAALIVAGAFPTWIVNRVESSAASRDLNTEISGVDLGLYHLCYNLTMCNTTKCEGSCRAMKYCGCFTYMDYDPPLSYPPSDGRRIKSTNLVKAEFPRDIAFLFSSSIVYAFGVGLFIVSLLLGAVACCKPRIKSCSMFLAAFIFQAFGGIILIVALALFPVFFGSTFIKQFCGPGAGYYQRGQCSLDWSLFVAMVATACTLYLPALAVFSMNISDGLRGNVCC